MAILAIVVGALLAACASRPITLGPVEPGSHPVESTISGTGRLQVFSRLAEQTDDQNQGDNGGDPPWYQHTDYNVYDAGGKRVKHVDNTVGHYSTSPRIISLRPGKYTVIAPARDWLSVRIPVIIERNKTTQVHLDDNWRPPPATPKTELVSMPNGTPVGWRANGLLQR